MGIHFDERNGKSHQICRTLWIDSSWRMSHSTEHLQHMVEDFIEETERWDLGPNLRASGGQARQGGREGQIKILSYFFQPTGTHESVEEHMQKAH